MCLLFNEWSKHNTHEVYKSRRYVNGDAFSNGRQFVVVAKISDIDLIYEFFTIDTWDLFSIPEKSFCETLPNPSSEVDQNLVSLDRYFNNRSVKETYQSAKISQNSEDEEEDTFYFSEIIGYMEFGLRVARKEWFKYSPRGKVVLYLVKPSKEINYFYFFNDGKLDINWKPSANDCLANDWVIV